MRKAVMTLAVIVGLLTIACAPAVNSVATPVQAAVAQNPVATAAAVSGAPVETWTQTYIAQQDFEHGYMFWHSPTKSIWVLLKANDGATTGEWDVYQDTFQDGEQEIDQSLTPPSVNLYQPRRGFGKLWRQPTNLFTKLGWATTPEFDESTPMSYLAGANGGVGRYLIFTLGQQVFSLTESTPGKPGGTWTLEGKFTPGNPNESTFTPTPGGASTTATPVPLGPVSTAAATVAAQ